MRKIDKHSKIKLNLNINLIPFSKNLLVYYCKWCNLIGYATHYLLYSSLV